MTTTDIVMLAIGVIWFIGACIAIYVLMKNMEL